MINTLITGGSGQLATCIRDLEIDEPYINGVYTNSLDLDVTKLDEVLAFFNKNTFDFCVNCAAYTSVDNAESDQINAKNVNEIGAKNLAIACQKSETILIHISTDFVFDGTKSVAYKEEHETNPTGIYGLTKLKGEEAITRHLKQFFIIRTSWLYSEHGNNFMKTMIHLSESRTELSVVDDQIGTPTYAPDLAGVILKIIKSKSNQYGIYHYSNHGVASWYDFAHAIFEETNNPIALIPIKSKAFPTPAKRPNFSVLDKTKIKTNLNVEIPYWRDSLKIAIAQLVD